MIPGRLRHRVRIERAKATLNDYRETVGEWETVATVWAEIKSVSGKEFLQADQVQATVSHKILIRKLSGVGANCRAVMVNGGRIFYVQAVLGDPTMAKYQQLMCVEKVT